MEATTAKAVKPAENAANTPAATTKYSFYQKIFFLYFLNLIDWVCTEALLYSGKFYEANPVMFDLLRSLQGGGNQGEQICRYPALHRNYRLRRR